MATAAAAQTQAIPMPVPVEDQETHELTLTDNEAAQYDEVIKGYVAKDRFSWWNLGEATKMIRDLQLWKRFAPEFGEDPFSGLDDYLERRGQRAKSNIWLALKLRDVLENVGAEHCVDIPRTNAVWMMKFIQRVKKDPPKAMIKKAKEMKEKLFGEYVNSEMPGAAREEVQETISFGKCDKSLKKVVDEAIEVAMWESESKERRDGLERICAHFLESKCEHEGFKNLSNREAFAKAQGKKKPKAKAH